MTALLAQQSIIADFVISHPEAAIFADPGTGKTRSVIHAVEFLISDLDVTGVLIIAPLRVATLTWPGELEKWSHLTYADLRTPEGIRAWNEGTAQVFILNYEQIPTFAERCLKRRKKIPANMIIFDESSKTRNPSSVRMKALASFRHLFKRFVGLTGTPQPNSALDLFGQIKVLDGGKRLGTSYHSFRAKYAHTTDWLGYQWELLPGSEEMIREKIRDMTLVMRGEDWLDLPPVTFEDIDITLPPTVMANYKKLQKDLLIEIGKKEVVALTAASLVSKLSQFCSGQAYRDGEDGRETVPIHDEKLRALEALHKKIHHRPLLVFIQFISEGERIVQHLPQARMFDGTAAQLEEWNAGRIPMLVAHPKSAGFGLQLQGSCHDVVWYTLGYSAEDHKQGNARIIRIGQKNPVTVYRLLVSKSVDWAQAEVIRGKLEGENALKAALRCLKLLAESS